MERRVNLIDLKNLLRAELKVHDEKKAALENALYESELIYNNLMTYIDSNSRKGNR